ncbi:tetratricopeptide repeat protein [Janthinobacterium psychrotolerans]|uniref:protein O-GlcNAc transferase n=1 Tax=Janthinobacterium psychrotolerans TaxID=1747903 RepID=A0A1A7C9G0_9BURK|nr:tetratricopeptide repeat protein [Janthinobacterium psychrotolerans]OBV40948.1 putative O-linked N-acetylglucosamine transferase, SPINDLY family [Janthinobacterium psychrotolerans]
MEQATRALLERYPASALLWSVLAMALQLQGKDGLAALQETVELAPADAEGHLHLGNAHMDGGHPDLAMPCFMRALELAPGFAEAMSRLGDALQAQGHLKEAAECYRGALELDPALAMAHAGKADILQAQQQFQAAEASYRQALALAPGATDLYRKLGDVQVALNRPEPAMQSYAAALAIDAGNAMAHGGLGNVLFRLDRNAQAAASYRAATALPAAIAAHYHGLGRSLHALGETAEAEIAYRQAIALDATVAAPMLHYADLLRETRRQESAIAIYQAALLLEPHNIDALNNLGMALQDNGQLEQALATFRQVALLTPDNPITHSNIAATLNAMGQREAALQSCRRAVKLGPKSTAAHVNLGTCLMEMGRLSEAVSSFETVVKLDPLQRRAHVNISAALARLGRVEQAIAHARQALKINPDWDELHSNLLFYLTHSPDIDAAALFAEHLRYAEHFEAPLRASWPLHTNTREPERRLRIGFVSADLYNHAVAHFITPILEHLALSPRLEIVIYANSFHIDPISRHLHGLAGIWRQVEKLTHAELAQLITSDAIDILIDLSGHTGFNRLPTFARKPAPLQLTWIGYPGTTGLQAMDYFLTDRYYSPPGVLDDQFTEKLIRLPACAPFLPSPAAPEISAAPSISNGHITFGSFNRASKLSREVIARWSALLRAAPETKMLLAAMPNKQASDRLRSWFAREGIAADRLTFHGYTSIDEYLALHSQVDLCLDTYPYTSGTTGFHALWMGVPTLTMPGPTLPGFVSAAILSHAGLADFIADGEQDFLAKGLAHASDPGRLASMRLEMRERMNLAASGQPAEIAVGLEVALRHIWQRWCAGAIPVSFEARSNGIVAQPQEEGLS